MDFFFLFSFEQESDTFRSSMIAFVFVFPLVFDNSKMARVAVDAV